MSESELPRWLSTKVIGLRVDWPLWLLDAALVAVAYVGVVYLRFDGSIPPPYAAGLRSILPELVVAHLAANAVSGVYGRVWRQASIEEARRLLVAAMIAAAAVSVIVVPAPRPVPASTVITGGVLTLALLGGARFRSRVFAVRRIGSNTREATRVIVVGSDHLSAWIIRDMLGNPDHGFRPVAALAEDERLGGRRLCGVPVLGGLESLPDAVRRFDATMLLLATAEASGAWIRDVVDRAGDLGLEVKVLPSLSELVGSTVGVRDVRDLSIGDLLGRKPVTTDLGDVRRLLSGRRVLITGAGGSIGAEIARQVAAFGPSQLVLLDHDETHLHDAMARISVPALAILADIRDRRRVDAVFDRVRPEIVFHAAAHKHVPVLEDHPCEAIATNVAGTDNVVAAASAVGVRHFVLISTDKAVRPANVMGATKRVAEQLVLSRRSPDGRYCAVRFGNVLGSRGSVVPTFARQIQSGGPVTVTDPNMTRFFMSIPEAVQLVLQAAAMSRGGDLFMLDMGEPVRIVDLARRMIELSGAAGRVDIAFVGLRPGEKLAEELYEPEERRSVSAHPGIMTLQPILVSSRTLRDRVGHLTSAAAAHDDEEASRALYETVSELQGDRVIHLPEATPAVWHEAIS